ncbi:MAG: GAF domain-containing protein [Gemmatimonadaceae bacterium]|nr:GAF domain-containing protein [Gemmatimonadaceae bacterium]
MTHRFRPDPELHAFAPVVMQRARERGAMITGPWLRGDEPRLARELLVDAIGRCGADEGTVWLLRGAALVPAINTGPHADRLVDLFQQPVSQGIIGMVAVTEQSFCENGIEASAQRDGTLDTLLGVRTAAMLAVPLAFGGAVRGVVSCVLFTREGAPRGFAAEHLERLERDVHTAGRLLDLVLLDGVLGLHGA